MLRAFAVRGVLRAVRECAELVELGRPAQEHMLRTVAVLAAADVGALATVRDVHKHGFADLTSITSLGGRDAVDTMFARLAARMPLAADGAVVLTDEAAGRAASDPRCA